MERKGDVTKRLMCFNEEYLVLKRISGILSVLMLFFFFKQKTAYEIGVRLVGSEMCIRDRTTGVSREADLLPCLWLGK